MSNENKNTISIFVQLEAPDFDTWYHEHDIHADHRKNYGIIDGPVYRDISNPNSALVHLMTDDLPKAKEWFGTDLFKAGTKRAKVSSRKIYMAENRK
ncbi:MAG: hypothetical protein ACFFE8_16000 [Candidatus Heimdallarchaeota archaeon]